MPWSARFSEPVPLPDDQQLATLRDAGAYISRLPDQVYKTEEWRTATHLLIQAAEDTSPVELARFAIMLALFPEHETSRPAFQMS